MTKEDIYIKLNLSDASHSSVTMRKRLDEFFDSNVCIPKGERRHLYADVLHEWIEGAVLLADNRIDIYTGRILEHCSLILDETNYRIKPSEPVYEWQWLVMHHQAYIVSDYGRFMTLEETCDGMMPIEETQRVRE